MVTQCRCGGIDWRVLRLRMGYSTRQFAGLFGVSQRTIIKWEQTAPHRCAHPSAVLLLHVYMHAAPYRSRLAEQGIEPPPEPPLAPAA